MTKWLVALLITVFIAGVFLPRLAAFLRIGRLPGDVSFRIRGRLYNFPFGTTVLLSLLATLLYRLI